MIVGLLFLGASVFCFLKYIYRNDWKSNDINNIKNERPNRFYFDYNPTFSNNLESNTDLPDENFSFSNGDIY